MTDRELLEMAAKSTELDIRFVNNEDGSFGSFTYPDMLFWNPLADDGDAFRLVADLEMTLEVNHSGTSWHAWAIPVGLPRGESVVDEDSYAAARRAIVRAAAEIGRTMGTV